MQWTKYFIPTTKEIPAGTEAVSHQLLLRSGLVHMLTSGVYSYLPLGLRVLRRIENIIREEMNAIGAQELFLPCLQPVDLWKKTGRDEVLKDVMISFKDQRERQMCLGPTHEEVITQIVKDFTQSYRQLPVVLYQIQTKFRDEIRPRFGIVRACEFIMKDAYSFDRDQEGLNKNYQLMYEAYSKIFDRCGLDTIIIEADSGAMGGDVSHEYMVPAPVGEDVVLVCPKCGHACGITSKVEEGSPCPQCKKAKLEKKVAIEIGHIFKLQTKYSDALDAKFIDETGKQQPIIMGCYGIGVSRLIATIIEKHNDKKGIKWPVGVAPFSIEILPLQVNEKDLMTLAWKYYEELGKKGYDVLIDDRDESAGIKFNDADLIGIPLQIIIGKKKMADNQVELKLRSSGDVRSIDKEHVVAAVDEILKKGN